MLKRTLSTLALAGVASLGLGVNANAQEVVVDRDPSPCGPVVGSLLVYPMFDNTRGTFTFFTVTNTNSDVVNGNVAVEFIYIDARTCLEFNRSHLLTANDTLTVITNLHNPNMHRGYAYVFAKSPTTGKAIAWDHLAGSNLVFGNSTVYDVELNAIVYRAAEGLAEGADTDLDSDNVRDLDGVEYQQSADELIIPRFFGNYDNVVKNESGGGGVRTDLILIGLTGARFTTIIDFLIYNDNEEAFSSQYSFDCWDRVRLTNITRAFTRDFLLSTNHNPAEIQGSSYEAGWYRMDGNLAFSTAAQESDPAFLALQLERVNQAAGSAVAALPFCKGVQDNGGLLSLNLFGNE
jgi:hypothetical protein